MPTDLLQIIQGFEQIKASQRSAAIATVVKTSGSVYRRPGARMLVAAHQQMIGAISGGCLEADIWERAQPLLHQAVDPIVITYDTTASQDIIWGLGMGCNGMVQVLLESLHTESAISHLEFITQCWQQQQPGVIATIFQVTGAVNAQVSDRVLCKADQTVIHGIADQTLATRLLQDTERCLITGRSQVITYTLEQGTVEVFIDVIQPPVPLLVFGAGYDAIPVVQLAKQLGWQVTVIDHRPMYANDDRFPQANQIIVCHADEILTQLNLNPQTIAIVMTHHYLQDQALLKLLLPSPIRYLGILGSKSRTQQLLQDLYHHGLQYTESQLQRLYAPIGLDLGAETPDEIALAIVAEIQAVLNQRSGQPLREKSGAIHDENQPCPVLVL
ncbi:XdhC family protein [Pantanalinema sp. GBBB05]|uniref:XdhC family protein n=1 Tax=Pantanalinema sp. GBBB05 TaxID=2604139 RepID=UPI001D554E1B|nr:XdhC family protein [Pantanalinema sp. GBBB05]